MTKKRSALSLLILSMTMTVAAAQPEFRKVATLERPGDVARRVTGGREVELSPNGEMAMIAFYGSQAQLFDLQTMKAVSEPIGTAGDGEVGFVNSNIVYTADWQSMRLWDAQTGKAIGEPIAHTLREDTVIHPAISANGNHIATRSTMTSYQLWNVDTLKPIGEPHEYGREVNTLRFSKDSKHLFARVGSQLYVHDAQTSECVAGPMPAGYRFYDFPNQNKFIAIERNGDGRDELVVRATDQAGWPVTNRRRLSGKFKRLVELDGQKLLIQVQHKDYSPEFFVTSLRKLKDQEALATHVDRAFNLLITDDQDRWISTNIHNVSCQEFGKKNRTWVLDYHMNGSNQTIKLLDEKHLIVHDRNGKNSHIASCHRVSDGTKIWEQEDVNKVFVHNQRLFVCHNEGVDVWTAQE